MTWVTLDEKICQSWVYPGGEVGVRAVGEPPRDVLVRIQSSDDLIRLLMYLDALRTAERNPPETLLIPYLPYARQDRVAVPGDPLAILTFAHLLSVAKVRAVHSIDVHSSVAGVWFKEMDVRFQSYSPVPYLRRYLGQLGISRPVWFVAPDEGAAKKVACYAADLHDIAGVIQCRKVRDPETGKLSGFRVEPGPGPKPDDGSVLFLVDDICDGGRTFLGVAAAVAAHFNYHFERHLFTTHGIYSQGLQPLLSEFRTVGSTNSFLHGLQDERLITIPIEGTTV